MFKRHVFSKFKTIFSNFPKKSQGCQKAYRTLAIKSLWKLSLKLAQVILTLAHNQTKFGAIRMIKVGKFQSPNSAKLQLVSRLTPSFAQNLSFFRERKLQLVTFESVSRYRRTKYINFINLLSSTNMLADSTVCLRNLLR